MKLTREFRLTKDNAIHAPWGRSLAADAATDETAVEFTITREDFREPSDFDHVFEDVREVTCYSIKSRVVSRWGCEVNQRWIFIADQASQDRFRALWIASRNARGCYRDATESQAHCQQWMSHVMIDALLESSLPNASLITA